MMINKYRATQVISAISGMLFLAVLISTIKLIRSPDFEHLHNQNHVYIFKSAGAMFFLTLCLIFAVIARKLSLVRKR